MAEYDVIVIGGGPGGYVAAIRAAQLGQKTAVVERDKAGGRCLNYACIPAKTVLHTAEIFHAVSEDGAELGIKASSTSIDWKALQERRTKVSKTLEDGVAVPLEQEQGRVPPRRGVAGGRRQGEGRRRRAPGQGDRARDRLGRDADPGSRLLGSRDRHLGRLLARLDAEVAGDRRRRRVGLGDRLRLLAHGRQGDPDRDARPDPAARGQGHGPCGRAPVQEGRHGGADAAPRSSASRSRRPASRSRPATRRSRPTTW